MCPIQHKKTYTHTLNGNGEEMPKSNNFESGVTDWNVGVVDQLAKVAKVPMWCQWRQYGGMRGLNAWNGWNAWKGAAEAIYQQTQGWTKAAQPRG